TPSIGFRSGDGPFCTPPTDQSVVGCSCAAALPDSARSEHKAVTTTSSARRKGRSVEDGLRQADAREDLVERAEKAGVEGAELGVQRRRLIEAHRVDAVLEVVDVLAEERDTPLEVD